MTEQKQGYWARLWATLLGRVPEHITPPPAPENIAPPVPEGVAEARARLATVEMELRECQQRNEQMRSEYAALAAEKQRATDAAGQEQLERLYRKLAAPLANLMALAALAEAGQQVEAGDLLQLVKSLEKELTRAGMEPIGKAGAETQFDTSCHQRMSGGAVHPGSPVTVRLPGYRAGGKILLKAMVSAKEA
jgi:molecular chaperone GrpE (heat shock protein)